MIKSILGGLQNSLDATDDGTKHITVDGHDWYVTETKDTYPRRWLASDATGARFRFVEASEDHHNPECVSYPLDVDAEWEREALESIIRFRKGEYL